jgi:hypothetical protein
VSSVATSPPEQGQLVSVRSRQWIVNYVRPSTLPTPALKPILSGPRNLLILAAIEDDDRLHQGQLRKSHRLYQQQIVSHRKEPVRRLRDEMVDWWDLIGRSGSFSDQRGEQVWQLS